MVTYFAVTFRRVYFTIHKVCEGLDTPKMTVKFERKAWHTVSFRLERQGVPCFSFKFYRLPTKNATFSGVSKVLTHKESFHSASSVNGKTSKEKHEETTRCIMLFFKVLPIQL